MVVMVSLCAIVRCVCDAGPDDEQVLVQQATLVRHNAIEVGDLPQQNEKHSLMASADSIELRVEEFAQRHGKTFVGEEGTICTQSEMEEFDRATKALKDLKEQLSEQFKHDLVDVSKTIIERHMQPFMQASKRVEEAAKSALKPIFRDIIKYFLIQICKPAHEYDIRSVVKDFNRSMDDYKSGLTSLAEPIKGIWKEGYSSFDLLLNETLADMPQSVDLLSSRLLRMAPPDMSMSDMPEYFVFKVLPIIAVEMFPSFAKPISVLGRFPKDQGAFREWLTSEAMPVITQSGKELHKLKKRYQPSKKLIPLRLCSTCQEKYFAEVANTDTGCLSSCFGIFKMCASGVGRTCVLAGRDCIKCHTKHTAALDVCTGNATHAKDIANWNLIASMLDNATTTQGLDSFLTNISHAILDY